MLLFWWPRGLWLSAGSAVHGHLERGPIHLAIDVEAYYTGERFWRLHAPYLIGWFCW